MSYNSYFCQINTDGNFFSSRISAQPLYTVLCKMTIFQCFDNVGSIGGVTGKTSSSKKTVLYSGGSDLTAAYIPTVQMYLLDFRFSPSTCTIYFYFCFYYMR